MMRRCARWALTVGLVSGSPLAAWAQETPDTAAEEEEASQSVSLSVGNDFVSQYYFRGIVQETDGFIAQPSLEIDFGIGGLSMTM